MDISLITTTPFVVSPIIVLGVGVVLQVLVSRLLSSFGKGVLAVAVTVVAFGCVAAMWPTIFAGQTLDARLGVWDGPIGLTFHVDGLSLLFALMGTGIGAAILLFAVSYMSKDVAATRFYIIMQIFVAGLVMMVFAADLLLMYAGWELVGLCSFLLVSFWYTDKQAAAGARKVLVMTHLAGYGLLAGILIIFARTGTTLWTDPKVAQAFTGVVFFLMLAAAVAKSVQFPLHTWIPSAMAAPTPVSALLHAAVYVKAGVYLVARMHSFAPWPVAWQQAVVWLGTVTMIVGVVFAMIQHDAKRLLAFHTVSQIGYMMLGLGLGTPLGVAAALLHTLNHGLFKGSLFLGAGSIQHATGSRDMDRLGGLFRRMPKTGVLWLISAASIAGIPLFNGFVSKWLLYGAALDAGYAVPALVAWVVSVLTMFSFMKATSVMFFGEDGELSDKAHESPRLMLIGSGILAASCLVLGVAPQLAINNVIEPAINAMGFTGPLDVSWFGFSSAGGNFVLVGLVLAVLSVIVGFALHRVFARRAAAVAPATMAQVPVELVSVGPAAAALPPVGLRIDAPAKEGSFTGGEPLATSDQIRASDFSEPIARGLAPFYRWADPDRYYLAVWHFALRVAALCGRASRWLEQRAVASSLVIAVVLGVIAVIASLPGVTKVDTIAAVVPASALWPLAGAIFLACVALVLVLVKTAGVGGRAWVAALAGVLVVVGLLVEAELPRLLLLEAGAFAAVVLLFVGHVPRRAAITYLAAAVVSAVTLIAGNLLLDIAPATVVLVLIVVGFAVKLALVPTYVWLPAMAERTPAALVGLVIAVVDVAAFGELATLRQHAAWLFAPMWLWIALAVLSALGGAALALAQSDIKRMLAFSSMTGAGFLVMGVAVGGDLGVTGTTAGAAAEALSMALLFSALAGAERDGRPVSFSSYGLARQHPLACAGFLLGALATLGVPLTPGFVGHWRIYASALSMGWPLLAVFVVATVLSLLFYTRAIALVWWGGRPGDEPVDPERPRAVSVWATEPAAITTAIVVLAIAVLTSGLLPGLLHDWCV